MAHGTIEGTTWPVDTEDVAWRVQHTPASVSSRDLALAVDIMAAYFHMIDPGISDKDAQKNLKRARAVAAEIYAGIEETLGDSVKSNWVVILKDSKFVGPYTYFEAKDKADKLGGKAVELRQE